MDLLGAAANVRDRAVAGHLADLRRMPRELIDEAPSATLYRYLPLDGQASQPDPDLAPVLLVPPLGAPDFAYDLRRGCSLVEHLLGTGRDVYLVDYGDISFGQRGLGLEFWVENVVPRAVHRVSAHRDGTPVHLVGWCLGGIFSLLTAADRAQLPAHTITAVASPFDVSAVPLVAPLRPLAAITGGRLVSSVYQALGSIPAPMVKWAFQLSTVDKYLTKPLTVLSRLDDRDVLEQIEAVDYLMSHMHGYPGRTFGQIYHLMMRANDLGDGGLDLADRRIELAEVRVPVLVVAGENDVIAPLRAVRRGAELLTGSPEVRFETAPGGHLGVLTGRRARDTTWAYLDEFLGKHDVV
ncbi:MAG: poly[(R)-3-hydroxyalkanoate] polymerase subunit PhaC [Pseudonocardiales bacterium]|jgi:polyhydroxyalkanoate synthase|nr:poly[(R)-3-hydroxyalkanoate] polymerase subunit PhaC [Pseudonocardiales bacterium]MDT7563614.1 poly[(R)-3-hydroxyalkanoate] polymerase subunit PhaC [Pseudonocardiales bacterium]MDT7620034.1 poly[(R)-3-hydroxyalkanoate] polymerase subunit PhaC [Pseudonocardiales bacterium]MDT7639369.1 poly[(R)-3-hydroxyalkanoate] polymerase subunit PhaC [Pseudonocardiales bacterium]MDT7751580.1 poly[(R)-3-hydroxyalkanoate] polymerase subunit PhaC [Pseudonocardiales bacterium]